MRVDPQSCVTGLSPIIPSAIPNGDVSDSPELREAHPVRILRTLHIQDIMKTCQSALFRPSPLRHELVNNFAGRGDDESVHVETMQSDGQFLKIHPAHVGIRAQKHSTTNQG